VGGLSAGLVTSPGYDGSYDSFAVLLDAAISHAEIHTESRGVTVSKTNSAKFCTLQCVRP